MIIRPPHCSGCFLSAGIAVSVRVGRCLPGHAPHRRYHSTSEWSQFRGRARIPSERDICATDKNNVEEDVLRDLGVL